MIIIKELDKIEKALAEQGFTTRRTTKGHLRVWKDGVLITTLSGTPSDYRSLRNGLAHLKRAGFRWR